MTETTFILIPIK